jgi:hypothetical protein
MTIRLRSPSFFVALVVLLCSSAIGCKKKELKRYAWVDQKLGGADSPVTCDAALRGTVVALDFDNVPAASTITVRGTSYTPTGKLHVDIDIGDVLGALKTSDALGAGFELDPRIPIDLDLPNGTFKTEVPKQKYLAIGLKAGVGKPIKFGDDPPHAPGAAGPSLLWLGMEDELLGSAATLRDVDWVAAAGEMRSSAGPTCKYQDSKTGAISTAPLTVLAPEVVIYDRRTAHVVDKKVIHGAASCPLEKEKGESSVAAEPSDSQIKIWLKERRAKK